MERIDFRALGARAALVLFFCGCGPRSATETEMPILGAAKQTNTLAPTFQIVNQEIKEGKYDDAAAKLMGLRANAHQFNSLESADFRRAMSEAYSQAVEAAAKGDPRGKIAMEMIRASGGGR